MKKIFLVFLLLLPCFLYAAEQDAYYSDFNPDRDMTFAEKENSFFTKGIQYGGWATPAIGMREAGGLKTTVLAGTLRLWLKSYLWNDTFIYVRGKDSLSVPLEPAGMEDKNVLDLDAGYIETKLFGGGLRLAVGRKYFVVGTGLSMNGRGDGLEINYAGGVFGVKAFVNYSGLLQKDDNPYKISSADYSDGAKRLFAGGVLSTSFVSNQNFYIYGMNQKDFTKDDASKYDSMYAGAGAKGVVFSRLGYYGEFIYQMGKSISATGEKDNIAAMAVDAGIDLRFSVATEPVILIQYAYGSGDKDRISGLNEAGKDTNFISFGTFNGGMGLNPILSNLHVLRGGLSFQPFDWLPYRTFRRVTLVAKYSYYMKDKAEAPFGAGEGSSNERYVGQGGDAVLRWKIFSDVALFASYGIFIPGGAFDDGEPDRQFFLFGSNISF
jgi:hypothetical protein